MLLFLICLFLNYDLLHFEHARKLPARPNKSQPPVQMGHKPKHDEYAFIRELRGQMQNAQSERKGFDLYQIPEFGFGLDNYDISPMEDIRATKNKDTEQDSNIRNKPKARNLALDNEGFLDYDITDMFWSVTPKVEDTKKNTPPKFFLPTPAGFGITEPTSSTTPHAWQNFEDLAANVTTTASGPSDLAFVIDPGHHPEYPDHPIEGSTFTPFPTFTSNMLYYPYELWPNASVLPRPSFPFSVPPLSTKVPFSLIATPTKYTYHGLDNYKYYTGPLLSYTPTYPTTRRTSRSTTTTTKTTTTTTTTTKSTVSTLSPRPPIPIPRTLKILAGPETTSKPKHEQMWMKIRPTMDKSLLNLLRISGTQDTPPTQQPPEPGSTLSKAESWVLNKQWIKGSADEWTKMGLRITEFTTEPQIGSEPAVLTQTPTTPDPHYVTSPTEEPTPRTLHPASTQTVNTLKLMSTDGLGFLEVSIPPTLPEEDVGNVDIDTPTIAGDVLHNAHTLTVSPVTPHSIQIYHDMMHELNEGILMVFLLEFTRLVAEKDPQHVSEVIMPFELIMNRYHETGALAWIGIKLSKNVKWLSFFFTESGPRNDEFVVIMKMANRMLKDRKKLISSEINTIIDKADRFFNDNEGKALFTTLRDFEYYPNVSYTGYKLCQKLIDDFSNPFRSAYQTANGKELITLAEEAMEKRFGRRMSAQDLFFNLTETSRSDNSNDHKQKPSLKQRMEIKRRRKILLRRMFGTEGIFPTQTDQPLEYPRLRSMLPITNNQKRFRVITQRQKTGTDSTNYNMERPTRRDFRRSGRAVHPYNEMMQFFPQIPKEYLKQML